MQAEAQVKWVQMWICGDSGIWYKSCVDYPLINNAAFILYID